MDAVDRKILAELQENGRLTLTELADRVRLSVSPCHRRLRALETAGVIDGYRAQVDPHAVGLTFEALVFVIMSTVRRQTINEFEAPSPSSLMSSGLNACSATRTTYSG